MTGDQDDDERLLADLADAVAAAQAVPPTFLAAGKAAFAWHDVDAELAELSYDSASEPPATLAATRTGTAAPRTLSYAAGALTVEVELAADRVHGQVIPAQPGEIALIARTGPAGTTTVDEAGWFAFDTRPTGPFRLRLRTAEGRSVITAWTQP